MPTPLRMKRINDRIKQVLSVVLISKIDDPRLAGVSVTDVKVDRELDYANIYVSSLNGAKSSREVIAGLNHARGYLKHEIAQEVDLRVMPRLRFSGTQPQKEQTGSIPCWQNYLRRTKKWTIWKNSSPMEMRTCLMRLPAKIGNQMTIFLNWMISTKTI